MSNSEDYLDDLLNSVSSGRNDQSDIESLLDTVRKDESKAARERESRKRRREFGHEFYHEFEAELRKNEADDFIHDFELELDSEDSKNPQETEQHEDQPEDQQKFVDNIDDIVNEARKRVDEAGESEDASDDVLTSPEEPDLSSDEENLDEQPQEESGLLEDDFSLGEDLADETAEPEEATEDKADQSEDEELIPEDSLDEETEGASDDGLLDLLSGLSDDEELSDIGELLKADADDVAVSDDSVNALDQLGSIEELSDIKEGKKDKEAKEKKKGGFFAKLAALLFGEEEEEQADVKVPEEGSLGSISDENLGILKELDSAKPEEKPKEKKKKKEKEKKPKKEKPKKEKKPKVKKEKKPKEPDLTPPLPKKPVILIAVMAASVFLLIYLGANLTGYSSHISAAKDAYKAGSYTEAFHQVSGLSVKKADEDFYNECHIMAAVQEEYEAYISLMNAGQNEMALDSLIRGVGRHDALQSNAEDLGILLEFNQLETQLEQALSDQFNVSPDKALELYKIRKREDYSIAVKQILKQLGLD
ncbi:MAG: hypothetical protein MR425_02380 [Lachnospiraceae bacterium]|nr:hypothetical protein [Lachnospiraceae bacterium]